MSKREKERRARLAGDCRRWHITNTAIALGALVDRSAVSHWFAGRIDDSPEVEREIVERLRVARQGAA